jgi:lysyl endopeptidase
MNVFIKGFLRLSITIVFGYQPIHAQLNIGGKPISFGNSSLLEFKDIPVFEFTELDNANLKSEAEQNDSKDQPWQFGLNREVSMDLKTASLVEETGNGKLYRLAVYSKNALTLNFRFDRFRIPEKAVLYIYNEEKSDLLGGFTSQNNQADGIFATGLIKGDKILFEYFEPDDADFEGELILSQVTHGFRSISDYNKGFGQSGDCNMNVACPDALDWANEIRSICMLVTGGSALCSASLINTTTSDGTPYILTADHCYSNPSSIVFIFNWESATCNNPPVSPTHQDLSGASFISRFEDSDFFLMKMNSIPPYTYQVYYSGWYNGNALPSSQVCIHHPSGDIKKIAFDDHQAVSDQYLSAYNPPDSHWRVTWDRNTTTEAGSSGSPLFNENHRIIGQLHGGYASCSNLDESDWYGKFSYSWDMGTSPQTRLKEWLDPINTGIEDMPGYDPNMPLYDTDAQLLNIIHPGSKIFDTVGITPSFKVRNIGINTLTSFTLKYSIDDNLPEQYNWTGYLNSGEMTDITMEPVSLPSGMHNIIAYVTNPNGQDDEFHYNDTIDRSFTIYEPIFKDDFEKGTFWYLTGEFEIDKPQGLSDNDGYNDPEQAFSGDYVLGTDLTGMGKYPGDYEANIGFYEDYAVSPAIDCRNYENVLLKFQRYLVIDSKIYDDASIELYNENGWQVLWENSSTPIMETEWSEQLIDVSQPADGKTVLIKFIMGPTDENYQLAGWNIDDFGLYGTLKKDSLIEPEPLILYPNPAKHYVYAQFKNDNSQNLNVTLTNTSGTVIYEKNYTENEILQSGSGNGQNLIYINYGESVKGLFIIHIQTDKKSYSNKIILY